MARAGVTGGGYVAIGSVGGAAIRLHWSLAIGVLGAGMSQVPVVWLGLFSIIVAHELGHALIARHYRLPVHALEVHILGGRCVYQAAPQETQAAAVAWGGVLGQAVVLGITRLVGLGHDDDPTAQAVQTLTYANLFVMALNLLPLRGLDGAQAWLWFHPSSLREVARRQRLKAEIESIEAELAGLEKKKQSSRELN